MLGEKGNYNTLRKEQIYTKAKYIKIVILLSNQVNTSQMKNKKDREREIISDIYIGLAETHDYVRSFATMFQSKGMPSLRIENIMI